MPEWLATDNIAIGVLIAGYLPAGIAIRTLWNALHESRGRETQALREGIDIDRSYAAQLDSMAAVQSSMQRSQDAGAKAMIAGFDRLEKLIQGRQ